VYLSIERLLRSRFAGYRPGPFALLAFGLLTYALINVTWVFFRAKSFGKAWLVLNGMFGFNVAAQPILPAVHLVMVGGIVGGIVFAHWLMRERTLESAVARMPAPLLSVAWTLMLSAIVIEQGAGNAFIYFQF